MNLPGYRTLLLGCVLGLLSFTSGCHLWKKTDEPSPPPTAEDSVWSSHMRQPTPEGQRLGLDSRAREIERNLGVR